LGGEFGEEAKNLVIGSATQKMALGLPCVFIFGLKGTRIKSEEPEGVKNHDLGKKGLEPVKKDNNLIRGGRACLKPEGNKRTDAAEVRQETEREPLRGYGGGIERKKKFEERERVHEKVKRANERGSSNLRFVLT